MKPSRPFFTPRGRGGGATRAFTLARMEGGLSLVPSRPEAAHGRGGSRASVGRHGCGAYPSWTTMIRSARSGARVVVFTRRREASTGAGLSWRSTAGPSVYASLDALPATRLQWTRPKLRRLEIRRSKSFAASGPVCLYQNGRGNTHEGLCLWAGSSGLTSRSWLACLPALGESGSSWEQRRSGDCRGRHQTARRASCSLPDQLGLLQPLAGPHRRGVDRDVALDAQLVEGHFCGELNMVTAESRRAKRMR